VDDFTHGGYQVDLSHVKSNVRRFEKKHPSFKQDLKTAVSELIKHFKNPTRPRSIIPLSGDNVFKVKFTLGNMGKSRGGRMDAWISEEDKHIALKEIYSHSVGDKTIGEKEAKEFAKRMEERKAKK
jgi:mRNA-degrading endonuclease HigB of HigAB toxin-antitoxin module